MQPRKKESPISQATVRIFLIKQFPIICQITGTLKMLIIILIKYFVNMKCVVLETSGNEKGITKPILLGLQLLSSKLECHRRKHDRNLHSRLKTE